MRVLVPEGERGKAGHHRVFSHLDETVRLSKHF